MLTLDRSLAQAIVDRTMAIIDCNVIVMDASGIIIASGDPARLGTLHEGALLAFSKRASLEIDATLEQQLSGARQGVNLPLRAEGRIVGCVGLTGDPDAVRQYGVLLRFFSGDPAAISRAGEPPAAPAASTRRRPSSRPGAP